MAQLTEREQKIKTIYDSKIEQILANCSANTIIKDEINGTLMDSLATVKAELRQANNDLVDSQRKKNKLSTFLIIAIIIIVGLVVILYKFKIK